MKAFNFQMCSEGAAAPEFPVEPLNPEKMRDGIVVRVPNWLGDAVMAIPALAQLKKIIPEYGGLFVICPESLRELFESLPLVDAVAPLTRIHHRWSFCDIRRIAKLQAGVGILFNNSLRDALYLHLCGIHRLYGAKARGRGFLLKRGFVFPRRIDGRLNHLHHAWKYLSMVKALGAPEWDGSLPEFRIKKPLTEITPEIAAVCAHPKLLTVAAGAAYGSSKRWAAENFATVAAWWIGRGGTVAMLGSGKEWNIGEQVMAGLPVDKSVNLAGKTTIPELMHLLRSSLITLANDSGIMHLAAIMGKPGVAVFGPTDWSATGPLSDRWRILYRQQPCSPCFKRECRNGDNACMNAITPEAAIEKLTALIV